jgi:glycosyltransferase involved in cell wall biosynthesis
MKDHAQHRLRLLFLLPFPPRLDATDGGGRAMAQLLARLAERHDVALLCLRTPSEPGTDATIQERCQHVEEVPHLPSDANGWRGRAQLISSFLQGIPVWARAAATPSYAARLRDLARTWQPDIIQIQYHVMAQYVSALDGCSAPRVLTQYEPGAGAARDIWKSGQGEGRFVPYLDMLAWQRFEQRILRAVQAMVVLTERDRQALTETRGGLRVVCIPLGTDVPAIPLDPLGEAQLSLTFVGNFAHPPNVDAAVRLADSILPSLLARFDPLTLYIVGDHPPPQLCERANLHVVVTGKVTDVSPYLDRAAVVPVPLRWGGGMRVKVLEALAAGKAVVASPLAVEGLDLQDGVQVLIADTDEQFSNTISKLLADPQRRGQLAERARAWACANLRWDNSVLAYENLYLSLLTSSTQTANGGVT